MSVNRISVKCCLCLLLLHSQRTADLMFQYGGQQVLAGTRRWTQSGPNVLMGEIQRKTQDLYWDSVSHSHSHTKSTRDAYLKMDQVQRPGQRSQKAQEVQHIVMFNNIMMFRCLPTILVVTLDVIGILSANYHQSCFCLFLAIKALSQ